MSYAVDDLSTLSLIGGPKQSPASFAKQQVSRPRETRILQRDRAENRGDQSSINTVAAFVGSMAPSEQISRAKWNEELADALKAAALISAEMVAADEADPYDAETWLCAFAYVERYFVDVQIPLMLPLQMGGVSAEWHENGINLELRFRTPSDVYVLIEDAREVLPAYTGWNPRDSILTNAAAALMSRKR